MTAWPRSCITAGMLKKTAVPKKADVAKKAYDLKGNIVARRFELLARLRDLKADTSKDSALTRDRIKARLSLLDHTIKLGITDGWDNLDDAVKLKLNDWLNQ